MKNISAIKNLDKNSDLVRQEIYVDPVQEEVTDSPFRFWANQALARANPDLPVMGFPPKLAKKFTEAADYYEVGGYKIPRINNLTAGESFFAGWFQTEVTNKQGEIDSIFRLLAANYRNTFPSQSLSTRDARSKVYEIMTGTATDVARTELTEKSAALVIAQEADDPKASELELEIEKLTKDIESADAENEEFAENNAENIREIYRISNTTADPKSQKLLFACALLAMRVDPDVSPCDIVTMTIDDIDAIMEFWQLENNKGVPLKKEPDSEPEPEPSIAKDDAEGKEVADKVPAGVT
jgi:hypothetical protein